MHYWMLNTYGSSKINRKTPRSGYDVNDNKGETFQAFPDQWALKTPTIEQRSYAVSPKLFRMTIYNPPTGGGS